MEDSPLVLPNQAQPSSPAQPAIHARRVGVVMLMGAAMLWSLVGLTIKIAKLPPLTFTVYRAMAAIVGISLFLPFSRGRRPHAGWMVLSATIYPAVIVLLIIASTISTAATGILLQYTAPAWVALLAWMFQRRRIGGRTALAMLAAVVGIVILIAGQPHDTSIIAPLAGAGSGLAFGALILVLEKLDRATGGDANPIHVIIFNNLGCLLLLLPLTVVRHEMHIALWQLLLLIAAGVVTLALPYLLFQLALRRVSPVDASLLSLLEPVLNPIWVALFTVEKPTPAIFCGGVFIIVALVIEATKPR